MKYTRATNITIEFTPEEYDRLLLLLGYSFGSITDLEFRKELIKFVNEMNEGNENFKPYTQD